MNTVDRTQPKPPSSLAFLASVLAVHSLCTVFWIYITQSLIIQVLGLICSFVALIWGSIIWWDRRVGIAARAVGIRPTSSTMLTGNLQGFIAEHLKFAVLTIWSDLGFQLETQVWPKSFGELSETSGEDFVRWLGRFLRVNLEEQAAIRFQLQHAFGMNKIQWSICEMNLPREATLKIHAHAYVRLSYVPYFIKDKLETVHIIIQEITEIKEREEQAQTQRREMEKFFALIQVSDSLFELFMSETRKLFDDIKKDLKLLRENKANSYQEVAARIFRAVHTIKANARLFKLNSIEEVAHQVETFLDELKSGVRLYAPETLGELTQQIIAISEEVYSYASLRKEILNTADRNSGFNFKYRIQWIRSLMKQFASVLRDPKFEQRHLQLIQKEFSRALSSFDKASLKEYIRGYNQMIRDVAMQLGKEVNDLQADIAYHSFDSATLARINDILLHCMRNAIDHGIERPDERVKAGKPRAGQITLRTYEKDGLVRVEVADDGRGIDVEKINAKAVELGLIKAEAVGRTTEAESLSFLFHPGVSTATSVTEISGRGLGMDVVRDYVQGLNGQLGVEFVKGQSTSISIWIPATTEEIIAPLAIHEITLILQDLCSTQPYMNQVDLTFTDIEHSPVFIDRSSLCEVLKLILGELRQRIPDELKVDVRVSEHMGRRRVDSYNFYRLQIGSTNIEGPWNSVDEESGSVIAAAAQLIRRNGGSLIMKNPYFLELNIPSNLPVRYNQYSFKIIIMTERLNHLNRQIENFFRDVMANWNYEVYRYPFGESLPEEVKGSPCLILLDSALMKKYVHLRSENDRKTDGVVLFPEEELDFDALNSSAILPENILFVPPSFDEKHFHTCLAGVIFRRFLKEMVRESSEEEAQRPLSAAS